MNTKNTNQLLEEKAASYGALAMSDYELLASVVGEVAANNLMETAGSFRALRRLSLQEIKNVDNVTPRKAMIVYSLLEAGARAVRSDVSEETTFDSVNAVYNAMFHECEALNVEKFWVFCLDRKNRLKKKVELTSGTSSSCMIDTKQVFEAALVNKATTILCVHNHPSGDPAPSRNDVKVTRSIREASNIMSIAFLDHVIIGNPALDPSAKGFYSFSEEGMV